MGAGVSDGLGVSLGRGVRVRVGDGGTVGVFLLSATVGVGRGARVCVGVEMATATAVGVSVGSASSPLPPVSTSAMANRAETNNPAAAIHIQGIGLAGCKPGRLRGSRTAGRGAGSGVFSSASTAPLKALAISPALW